MVTQLYDDTMRPTGLRATQFALLVHIHAMGPVALTKLAEAMVTDRTTLARNLEVLEKNGLIEIEYGNDRRTRILRITKEGREKVAEAYPIWKRTQDGIKEIMGRDEWAMMISQLSLLVDLIQKS
ncbi:MAG: MarR family winged helix-turn-helix transcriptional regulator [Thermodesulfobacteriota bacterium]